MILLCCTDFHPPKKKARKWSGRLSILVLLPLKLFSAVNEWVNWIPRNFWVWGTENSRSYQPGSWQYGLQFSPSVFKSSCEIQLEQDTPCVESNTTNTIPCRLISHLCPRSPFLSRHKCFLLCIMQILWQAMLQPFHIGHWFWLAFPTLFNSNLEERRSEPVKSHVNMGMILLLRGQKTSCCIFSFSFKIFMSFPKKKLHPIC